MTFTLSPPVRLAAIIGLAATVLLAGGLKMLGGGGGGSVATPHITHHPFGGHPR